MSEAPHSGEERKNEVSFEAPLPDSSANAESSQPIADDTVIQEAAEVVAATFSEDGAPSDASKSPPKTLIPPQKDEAVEQEVDAALSAMSQEDLAELTMSEPAPSTANSLQEGVQLGRIEAIRGDDVFINLGSKTQGLLTKDQFKADEIVAIGEPVEVVIDRYDRAQDLVILSRKGQARRAEWDLLKPGDIVEGRVIGLNRGGLEVQLQGIKAFMPASQVDVMHIKDISIFLNECVMCEVLEIDRRGKSLTISRRKLLEKELAVKRQELLAELEVGQIRKGVVGNLADFGAFVDLGGVDGLIHIRDMSYRQIKNPSEVVKTGDVVEVKILKIQDDKGKKRISLGIKQALPDPWDGVEERFPANSTQRVRIVRLADFGAFAELEEGIDGLIPISEMSWSRIGRPSEVVEVGKLVDVRVMRVDKNKHRISLSMKQAQPDPWAEVMNSFTPETMVDGKVTRLADFGVFVELVPGVEGMIHISELSDRRVKTCAEVVKVDQEIKARILSVDSEARRISLSLKPASSGDEAGQAADFGKAKPKKKSKKLRGGLSAEWDWAGAGLEGLAGLGGDKPQS